MSIARPRLIFTGAWLGSVLLAFAAGRWMDATGAIEPSADGERPGAMIAENGEPEVIVERARDAWTHSAARLDGDTTDRRGGYLAMVSAGSAGPAAWESAMREAGLISTGEARAWFDTVIDLPPGQRRDRLLSQLLARIAQEDPTGALELTSMIGGLQARESALRGVLEEWAVRDPTTSLAWIEENSTGLPGWVEFNRLESWVEGYAKVDPRGAFDFVAARPGEGRRDLREQTRLIEEVIGEQIRAGQVGEAIGMLETLPEGRLRDESFRELYSEWAEEDPEAAAQHFLANPVEGSDPWAQDIVRSWAESDPGAAADFVASLGPENEGFERSVSALIERWTRYDLQAPAEWLNRMPPSPEIDRAVAVYSMRAASEDPQGAMTWAESIASEQSRERIMLRVAANWQDVDEEGFNDYLEQSEFDDEFEERLRSYGSSRGGRGFGGRFRD